MATTSFSGSLIPTSTLSSASSTPTNNPNDNGGGPFANLFSASESPPLIVAFLAIGVFIVALSGVFGWRRLSQPQGVVGPPPGATTRRRKSILLGKKPVLWDVWTDLRAAEPSSGGSTIGAEGYYRWEHILPMSTSLTFPVSSVEPEVPVNPISATARLAVDSVDGYPMPSRMLMRFASAVRRYYLPVRLSRPPPPLPSTLPASPPPPPTQAIPLVPMASRSEAAEQLQLKALAAQPCVSENTLDEGDWGDALSVQVSVIVAMPTQRRPGCQSESGTSGKEDTLSCPERMRSGLAEYCIGTVEMPWGEAG